MKSDLSRKAEDYLEAVYVISQEKGHVRIRDICKELGTKPPSVPQKAKRSDASSRTVMTRYLHS